MKIGELARKTQTKVETVRFYEKIGLLGVPERTESNYRDYSDRHLERLAFVRRARDLGFALDQVRALLALSDGGGEGCDAIDSVAREHLAEIDRKIAGLEALRSELTSLVDHCSAGPVSSCKIIEALIPRGACFT